MILSILIPSIPERRNKLTLLLNELYKQVSDLNRNHPSLGSVEILIDDSIKFSEGGLSIGAKRDLLKQRAGGKYLCFLDDDDGITPNYVETLVRLCSEGQSIVTFRTLIKNDHYWGIIDMNLETTSNDEVNPVFTKQINRVFYYPYTAIQPYNSIIPVSSGLFNKVIFEFVRDN